jgi:hypothetical protein
MNVQAKGTKKEVETIALKIKRISLKKKSLTKRQFRKINKNQLKINRTKKRKQKTMRMGMGNLKAQMKMNLIGKKSRNCKLRH